MNLLFASPEVPIDQFMQYGAFGIVVFLVFWYVWIGHPKMMDKFENSLKLVTESSKVAITNLADKNKEVMDNALQTFKEAEDECREERREVAASAASERDKDRELRHNLANQLQKLADHAESKR